MTQFDELVVAAAVAADAVLAAGDWADASIQDEVVSDAVDNVLKKHNIPVFDENEWIQQQCGFAEFVWKNANSLALWNATVAAVPVVRVMRHMERETLAMEAFGPLSIRSRIAALLLAEDQPANEQGGES